MATKAGTKDAKQELRKAHAARVRVDGNDLVHLQFLDEALVPYAEFVMDCEYTNAVIQHLEAGRDKAMGLIPSNAIH